MSMAEIDDEALELDELRAANADQFKTAYARLAERKGTRAKTVCKDRRGAGTMAGPKLSPRTLLPVYTT